MGKNNINIHRCCAYLCDDCDAVFLVICFGVLVFCTDFNEGKSILWSCLRVSTYMRGNQQTHTMKRFHCVCAANTQTICLLTHSKDVLEENIFKNCFYMDWLFYRYWMFFPTFRLCNNTINAVMPQIVYIIIISKSNNANGFEGSFDYTLYNYVSLLFV